MMGDITANPCTIIFGLALISLMPILVSIGTAFLKFVVVFKLLLFVVVDGWSLLLNNLALTCI